MDNFKNLEFIEGKLKFINQVKLPLTEEYFITDDYNRIAEAIERLEIRGAPAIGVAAAYALSFSIKNISYDFKPVFEKAYARLFKTRPTAVNLFWALNEIKNLFESNLSTNKSLYNILIEKAKEIHHDDEVKCDLIGRNGLKIFTKKSVVLTHCNAGALATAGDGTALNVIKHGFINNLVSFVYADETRPLNQGSRLTAFELHKAGIPFAINTDSTAAYLMQAGKIDIVVTGADRIAVNGDSANKIGTYSLAALCRIHNIPFFIAAPTTTIDSECKDGSGIKIELRDKKELNRFGNFQITRDDFDVYSPAFDVTPHAFISGIITEKGLHKPPYNFTNV
ncbi:MAG: S-methyl-5-thioribose-1-phosphate isomerase [Flavobacterium sp.]|nr:S-methyl-5-thioribose-1-phosphate isomerase [Flavobacterium sp.]